MTVKTQFRVHQNYGDRRCFAGLRINSRSGEHLRLLERDEAFPNQALAYARLGGLGISTHSFMRTALTNLSNARIPLWVIQEISGHRSLASLQRYLEVSPEQKKAAIAALGY